MVQEPGTTFFGFLTRPGASGLNFLLKPRNSHLLLLGFSNKINFGTSRKFGRERARYYVVGDLKAPVTMLIFDSILMTFYLLSRVAS